MWPSNHWRSDIQYAHRYSKMTRASIYWWSHFARKTFFSNSHLHHSFPTWDNDAHTLFSISHSFLLDYQRSQFFCLLFERMFFMCICVCMPEDRLKRKDNATFGPICHVMPKLHFQFWQLPQLIDGDDECGKRLSWQAACIFNWGCEKSSLCAFHLFSLFRCKWQKIQPLFDFIDKPGWIMNRRYTRLFKYDSTVTRRFVCLFEHLAWVNGRHSLLCVYIIYQSLDYFTPKFSLKHHKRHRRWSHDWYSLFWLYLCSILYIRICMRYGAFKLSQACQKLNSKLWIDGEKVRKSLTYFRVMWQ